MLITLLDKRIERERVTWLLFFFNLKTKLNTDGGLVSCSFLEFTLN